MKLEDLYIKKAPLKLNDEIVEDVFVKEAPLSDLIKLQDLTKEQDLTKKLEKAADLIKICIVDKQGNCPFDDKTKKLSTKYLLDIVAQIIEVNSFTGK